MENYNKYIYFFSPFLLLPKRYDYLMNDLLKMLRGEEIDEVSYFVDHSKHLRHYGILLLGEVANPMKNYGDFVWAGTINVFDYLKA